MTSLAHIDTQVVAKQFTAVIFGEGERDGLVTWAPDAIATVRDYLERWGAGPATDAPFVRFGDDGVEVGFVATTPVNGEGDVEGSDLPSGTVAVMVAAAADVDAATDALRSWIADQGGTPKGAPWEELVDGDPGGERRVCQAYRPA